MTGLLELKEKLKNFYGRFDIYLKPLFKFILATGVFSVINGNIGYMERATSLPAVLAMSLACAILPLNVMIFLAGVLILLHLYSLSLEVAAVAFVLFALLALLYFRFAPKDGIYTILTPLCLHFQLGPVMPIAAGLMGKAYSIVSIICGTLVWFFLDGVKQNAAALGGGGEEAVTAKITAALNLIMGNKEMFLAMGSFLFVTILVMLIRRLSIDYAWTAAILVGALANFIILFAGYLLLGVSGKLPGLIISSLLSLVFAFILEFLFFNLDYSRTERVQFEDDEYYYYVKAVPKMYVAEQKKRVQTFNAKGGKRTSGRRFADEIEED